MPTNWDVNRAAADSSALPAESAGPVAPEAAPGSDGVRRLSHPGWVEVTSVPTSPFSGLLEAPQWHAVPGAEAAAVPNWVTVESPSGTGWGRSTSRPEVAAIERAAPTLRDVGRTDGDATATHSADPASMGFDAIDAESESAVVVRSASTLGTSVLLTAALGFVVQFLVQDHLGPERSGAVGGAESRAILLLGLLSLGVDTYALKEVALRPKHAADFVPGVVALRAFASTVIVAIAALVLSVTDRGREGVLLFALFGVSRFLLQTTDLLGACLKAVGVVGSLPRINVVSKVVWAAVVLGGVLLGRGPISVPVGWVCGELVRLVSTERLVRSRLGLRWTLRNQAVRSVVRASLPFTAGTIVAGWSMYFDTTLMSFVLPDREVGLYRFAQQISGITFLLGTVLPWVILPLASRAFERSEREYHRVAEQCLRYVFVLSAPAAVLFAMNADSITHVLGAEWRPAIPALRILSLSLVTTYLVIVAVLLMQVEGRAWIAVRRSAAAVAIGMIVNLSILRFGTSWFGVGGAGTLASLVVTGVELLTAVWLFRALGRNLWTPETRNAALWTVLACLTMFVLDRLVMALGLHWVLRGAFDVVVAPVQLVLWGALTPREIRRAAVLRRSGAGS